MMRSMSSAGISTYTRCVGKQIIRPFSLKTAQRSVGTDNAPQTRMCAHSKGECMHSQQVVKRADTCVCLNEVCVMAQRIGFHENREVPVYKNKERPVEDISITYG
mmetsp:Transcript_97850/g.157795  ORF Transcript_97850/g.157795 Transcript_97850/m.157795 type:complete len:105 (-) Transcript_97850:950-1264(-)